MPLALDHGDAFSHARGLQRRLLAGRARADDDEVVLQAFAHE
jgi:hypothetical protein